MDDFEEKKMVLKEKFQYLKKRIPLQKCHKIFWHIPLFQNNLSIFIYFEKQIAFYNCGGSTPPPLADASAMNAIFFRAPLVVRPLKKDPKKIIKF